MKKNTLIAITLVLLYLIYFNIDDCELDCILDKIEQTDEILDELTEDDLTQI